MKLHTSKVHPCLLRDPRGRSRHQGVFLWQLERYYKAHNPDLEHDEIKFDIDTKYFLLCAQRMDHVINANDEPLTCPWDCRFRDVFGDDVNNMIKYTITVIPNPKQDKKNTSAPSAP